MALLFFVKNPIIFSLHCPEIKLKINSGVPSPIPKARKLDILEIKFSNKRALAKKAAIKAGLHGITIAPKKKPKIKAFFIGFLLPVWTFVFGTNLEKSVSNIKAKLIIPKIAKAIGETIPIILVSDFCNIVVKISPNRIIKTIIPIRIVKPNKKKVFLLSVPENLFDKNARNPGYRGRTQTAVRGVNKPRIKEVAMSTSKAILTTSFYFFL